MDEDILEAREAIAWGSKVAVMGCGLFVALVLLLVFGIVAILKWGFA